MKRSTKMCGSLGGPGVVGGMGLAAILLACGAASAQTADADVKARQEANRRIVTQPIRYARSVRPPVIDLEAMAKERRPGQVLPGDGYASGAMPYGAPRNVEPLGLPDTGRPMTTKATKRTDVPTLVMPKPAPQEPAPPAPVLRRAEPVPVPAAPSDADQNAPAAEPMQASHAIVHEPQPMTSAAPVEHMAPVPVSETVASESSEPVATMPAEQAPAPVAVAVAAPAPPPVASIPIVSPRAAAPVHSVSEPAPSPASAVGIEALLVDNLSAPLSTAPARVVVAGLGGVMSEAQWRTADSAWKQPRSDDALEGKIEVRAGINGEVTLIIDGQVQVTVSRLGRIVIERALEQGGDSVPTIALARGAIDIRPADGAPATGALLARVRTPDQAFGVRNAAFGAGAVRVEYDAFTGTRRRASNP